MGGRLAGSDVAREDVLLLLTPPTLQTSRIQRQLEDFELPTNTSTAGRCCVSVSTCSEPFLLPAPCPLVAAEFNESHGYISPWWPALG